MECACFFHVWADGAWRQPLAEFRTAITKAGFDGPIILGVIGSGANRAKVAEAWPDMPTFYADAGNESSTLTVGVRAWAGNHDGAILYAHTKGSFNTDDFRARWRRSMTRRVVENWRYCQALLDHDLENGPQAVGCHWLTVAEHGRDMFGDATVPAEGSGFFGGNFWMARCDYLRSLPPCPSEPRWEAERWIGLNSPRVVDLLPGWPHDNRWPELCG